MDPGTGFDPLLMDDVLPPELLPELPLLLDPMLSVADVADILPELDPVPPDPKSPPEPVPDPPELIDPLPNGPELPLESGSVVPATPLGLVSDDTEPPLNPVSDNPEPFPVIEIELPSGPNPSSGEPMLPPELVDSDDEPDAAEADREALDLF